MAFPRRRSASQIVADETGTSAVEFAIISQVFILLMFGMISYGIYFGAAHSVEQLVADAARASVAGLDANERKKLAKDYIDNNANQYMLLQKSNLKVDVESREDNGLQLDVSVQYDAANLPIWNLKLPLPVPQSVISRRSTIRIGGI